MATVLCPQCRMSNPPGNQYCRSCHGLLLPAPISGLGTMPARPPGHDVLLAIIVLSFLVLIGTSGVVSWVLLWVEIVALGAVFFMTRSRDADSHWNLRLVTVLVQMESIVLTVLGVMDLVVYGSFYGWAFELRFHVLWMGPPATSGVMLLIASLGLMQRRPWSWWLAVAAGLIAMGSFLTSAVIFHASPIDFIGVGGRSLNGIDFGIPVVVVAVFACTLNVRRDFRVRSGLQTQSPPRLTATTILAAVSVFVADVTLALAFLSVSVAVARRFDPDWVKVFLQGFLYLFLAIAIGVSALGIFRGRRWAWGLGMVASLLAVLVGTYRISQGSTVGFAQSYGGWHLASAWLTTILGAVVLSFLLFEFLFVRRSTRVPEGPPKGPLSTSLPHTGRNP